MKRLEIINGISFFLYDNILTGTLTLFVICNLLGANAYHVYHDVQHNALFFQGCHLCPFTLSNPVMYDLLSKCNCVSIEGELLVLMRLSHQLGRLSKLRVKYLFLL